MDPSTVQKISLLTEKLGMVYAGMGPDSRVLARKGRKAGQRYRLTYNDDIPCSIMVKELASVMQEFTQSGYAAFSVSLFATLLRVLAFF